MLFPVLTGPKAKVSQSYVRGPRPRSGPATRYDKLGHDPVSGGPGVHHLAGLTGTARDWLR